MSTRSGYGQRRIHMTADLLEQLLVAGNPITTTLPSDARFVRMYADDKGRGYYLVFESARWDELAEGEEIPQISVEAERDAWTIVLDK